VRPFLSPIADAYAAADLAIARAGAMTTAELCAWGIPAILVPLPTAAADHQTANARALEEAGAALSIRQGEFTAARLGTAVDGLLANPDALMKLSSAALRRGRPDAAETIAKRILTLTHLNELQS
jgi:UDP-N-acetylglucosamine--N-acetylmuramyl-(pentapeptide) pyrophosphoryl-undecaprenol N-acetylglucosamine transferase